MTDEEADKPERDARVTGATLGRYELLTKFATGGMAELYLARERGAGGLERVVVVKRLLPHLADRPESVEGFLREGRLVARLNHPNVVQTYELGEQQGEYFLAMEYLHGSTLRELQHLADGSDRGLPLWFAVSAVEQAARGLHAAHELRDFEGNRVEIIHRDVSPPNLMCTVDGYVKLLDFGVAKTVEGEEATQSGRAKGKFAYMSPEQLKQEELDRRSDLFALGIVTWELCTGDRLFKRESAPQTMKAILEERTPPPSSVASDIPPELDELVLGALKLDRKQRPASVDEMRRELVEIADPHDLIRDESELAAFVESVAGDRLEARSHTIKETLERTLTDKERARLRHERARGTASSGISQDSLPTAASLGSESSQPFPEAPPSAPTQTEEPPEQHISVEGPDADRGSADASDSSMVRRSIPGALALLAVLVSGTAIWAGWGAGDGEAADSDDARPAPSVSGPPLTYAIPPIASRKVLRQELAPFDSYLERRVGRPVDLRLVDSYAAASRGVSAGDFDVAMLPPLTFVRTRRREPEVNPLAVREMDGAVRNDGILLVRKNSEIHALEDLRGKTFCLTDRNSTTGNFFPRVALRKRGWEPRKFIGNVHWSGNHLSVLRDLLDGACAAAATYSGSLLSARNRGVAVGRIRTVAITGHTTCDTVTARPGIADDLARSLARAHLEFDPSSVVDSSTLGETLRTTGFQKPRPELYASLSDAVEHHAAILERFDMIPTSDASAGGDK